MSHQLYVIHALTAMHPGTGQGAGLIDLPVARERATDHPFVPGSSLKGVLRDRSRDLLGGDNKGSRTWALFGPDTDNASAYAGALQPTDAKVLLFPVQSDRGTFAWVSCPYALERLARDSMGVFTTGLSAPLQVRAGQVHVAHDEALHVGNNRVVLDGLPFERVTGKLGMLADKLSSLVFPVGGAHAQHYTAWNQMMRERLCVVDDDSFTWFVKNATEVRARVRINDDTGTVEPGGLWYEESLPPETVLAGVVGLGSNPHVGAGAEVWSDLNKVVKDPMQVGGNASVGQGLVRVRLHGGAA